MGAAILGVGQVSACGAGVEALRAALAGERRPPSEIEYRKGSSRARLPVLLADAGEARSLLPGRAARRLDAFSRNSLLSALLAARDAGVSFEDPDRVGVVAATAHGPIRTSFAFLDRIIDRGDDFASPMEFSISVHNAPASALASLMGIRGPCMTVTGFDLAWAGALAAAIGWMEADLADIVVALAGDEVHEVMAYALDRRGGWEGGDGIRPLDLDRTTAIPGETYAALVLGRPGLGRPRYGIVHEPVFHPVAADAAAPPVLVLAADGSADRPGYRALASKASRVVSYSALWGSSPTGDALATAAAAVCIRDGVIYPPPPGSGLGIGPSPEPLGAGSLAVASCTARGEASIIALEAST